MIANSAHLLTTNLFVSFTLFIQNHTKIGQNIKHIDELKIANRFVLTIGSLFINLTDKTPLMQRSNVVYSIASDSLTFK